MYYNIFINFILYLFYIPNSISLPKFGFNMWTLLTNIFLILGDFDRSTLNIIPFKINTCWSAIKDNKIYLIL